MIASLAVIAIGVTIGTVAALTIHRWFDRRDDTYANVVRLDAARAAMARIHQQRVEAMRRHPAGTRRGR